MRGQSITVNDPTTFQIEECCECGVPFAMTEQLYKERLRDKRLFYCPNGHNQQYVGKSDAQLRKEAEAARKAAEDQAAAARAELRKVKAEAAAERERLAKRAAAGVCPCCNRSFVQLARHMKTKHPDYG